MENNMNCDYCAKREYNPKHTARVRFGNNHYYNYYCRQHLNLVIESMEDMPYVKAEGYTIDYPFAENTDKKEF